MKKIRHILEYLPVYLIYRLCRLMPFSWVSALGGWLGRNPGYLYARLVGVADKNLNRAFPDMSPADRQKVMRKAADNFGRVFLEYFVMDKRYKDPQFKFNYVNEQEMVNLCKEGRPIVFFSGHIANWELLAGHFKEVGCPMAAIYRVINNPYVDRLILKCRAHVTNGQIPKGGTTGLQSLKTLKRGTNLAVLTDQKLNEGIPTLFFGHPAMTADGFIRIAMAAKARLVPTRSIRLEGTNFEALMGTPIDIDTATAEDVPQILTQVNKVLEDWVRETPDQWFWFHRRWPKEFYRE